jgi:hypothetical protein
MIRAATSCSAFTGATSVGPQPVRRGGDRNRLELLAVQQRPGGGWEVGFASYSPAAALEWRGHATVWALSVLAGYGVLDS